MCLRPISDFCIDEAGQDLVEYTLLLAFVVLTSAALLTYNTTLINRIWKVAMNRLDEAQTKSL